MTRIEALERALAEETARADKFGETLEQVYDLMDERKWGEAMELVSRVMHYPQAALSHPPVDTEGWLEEAELEKLLDSTWGYENEYAMGDMFPLLIRSLCRMALQARKDHKEVGR